jgi:hypothetical protein
MGPTTGGAILSGEENAEEVLCRLSLEDFGLRVYMDMIARLKFGLG